MLHYTESEYSAPAVDTRERGAGRSGRARVIRAARSESVQIIDMRDRVLSDGPIARREPVLLNEPRRPIGVDERRAVGVALRVLGHGFDAVAVAAPLVIGSKGLVPWNVVAVYTAIAMALLLPTTRRGPMLPPPSERLLSVIGRLGLAPVFTVMVFLAAVWPDHGNGPRSLDVVLLIKLLVVTVPSLILGRVLVYQLTQRVRRRGYDLEDALIVGTGPVGVEIARSLAENPQFGLTPCGFVDGFDDADTDLPIIGRPENLPEVIELTGIRHVVLAFGAANEQELVDVVRRVPDPTVEFYAVPRLFELGVSHDAVGHELDGFPLVRLRRPGHGTSMWRAKRAFDVCAALALLVLTSPVFVTCALAVKLSSPGPVFFRQVRVGMWGRPFEILKFRTMRVNDDSSTQWSVDNDDRITLPGRFLRPSHLDELPQLINVLRGEMSIVGPRPERPHFVQQFSDSIDGYDHRHRVPVGITGWAQVNGYWGDTSIETRVRLDNRYIENWSFWRDLVIGFRTIPTLLGKRR